MFAKGFSYTMRDYAAIFFKRKLLFFIPLIITVLVTTVYIVFLPDVYDSQSIILVEEKKATNPHIRGLVTSTTVSQRLNVLRQKILSWSRLVQLVRQLNLDKDIKGNVEFEQLIWKLRRQIRVDMRGSEIMTISYQHKDPQTTKEVVETITNLLMEENIIAQKEETTSALAFIEEELDLYTQKLEKTDEDIRKFKEAFSINFIGGGERERLVYQPVISRLASEIEDLEVQVDTLKTYSTEKHPEIVRLKDRIKKLKEIRAEQIKKAEELDTFVGDTGEYKKLLESPARQAEEFQRLIRDRAADGAIYADLLQRREKAKVSQRLEREEEEVKFTVLEPPRLPLAPVKRQRGRMIFLGFLAGTALGVGSIYGAEYVDHSFSRAEELEDYLKLPSLATIPAIYTEEGLNRRLLGRLRLFIFLSAFVFIGVIIILVKGF